MSSSASDLREILDGTDARRLLKGIAVLQLPTQDAMMGWGFAVIELLGRGVTHASVCKPSFLLVS